MNLNAGCEITLEAADFAPVVLMLRPQSGEGQTVWQSKLGLEPEVPVHDYLDVFGNHCSRLTLPPGRSIIRASCRVTAPDEIAVEPMAPYTLIQELPDEVLQYLLPSRYCESDRLLEMAWSILAGAAPGYAQAEAIRRWIYEHLRYEYGVSNASTSARDTADAGAGVCRDFAHLGIALCRSVRIPARMVVGYLYQLDPMDLHAWFEAFVGGRWYALDPTRSTPMGNRIVIAYGRDATDVAQLSEYGPLQTTQMKVWVEADENPSQAG